MLRFFTIALVVLNSLDINLLMYPYKNCLLLEPMEESKLVYGNNPSLVVRIALLSLPSSVIIPLKPDISFNNIPFVLLILLI